jgi:hypothetical protein
MITPTSWTLPNPIRLRLGQTTYGRQRAIVEEGHVLLVLHKPPGPDDTGREGVMFWRNPAGEWQFSHGGAGLAALTRHVQAYAEVENKLTQDYERASNIKALFNLLETLTPLTRAARNLHLALQAAREAVRGDTKLIELRDLAYGLARNFELLLEDVRNALHYRTAREAEEQARLGKEALRASHRLNILAALFFPLTAIASLFGMNLAHGLSENRPEIFWLVFAFGVGLGLAMRNWVLARPDARDASPKD